LANQAFHIIFAVPSRLLESCSAIRQEEAMGRKVWLPVVLGPVGAVCGGIPVVAEVSGVFAVGRGRRNLADNRPSDTLLAFLVRLRLALPA
jgi:hypothetical protein